MKQWNREIENRERENGETENGETEDKETENDIQNVHFKQFCWKWEQEA